jgi:hypothetical protein
MWLSVNYKKFKDADAKIAAPSRPAVMGPILTFAVFRACGQHGL